MRKLLLAGAAFIGMTEMTRAQTPPTLPPSPSGGYPSQPSVYLGGNNILNVFHHLDHIRRRCPADQLV